MAGSTWTHWSKGTERRKSKSNMCIWFRLIAFCCDLNSWRGRLLDLSTCVSTQGEPGYVIAGTDANFVPGRKGEPGSSVSPPKNSFGVFQQWVSGQLKYHSLHVTGSPRTSWCARGQWSSGPTWPARTIRVTGNICQGNMDHWTLSIMASYYIM